jgi:hypothetical protein
MNAYQNNRRFHEFCRTGLLDRASEKEELFSQRGFPRIRMTDDPEGPSLINFFSVILSHKVCCNYSGYLGRSLPAGRQAGLKTVSKGLNVTHMELLLLYYCNCFIPEKNQFSFPFSLQSKHLQPDYVSSRGLFIFAGGSP